MGIRTAFSGIYQSASQYWYDSQQATMAVISKLPELRNNPEFFQKVCQVAFNAIQLVIIHCPTAASLSRFSFALTTANMHDFYCFLKQPRQWFFPITAEGIDENETLESLTNELYLQFHNGNFLCFNPMFFDNAKYQELKTIAANCLKAQLGQMREKDDAYRNIDEFKGVLQRRLLATPDTPYYSRAVADHLRLPTNTPNWEITLNQLVATESANLKMDFKFLKISIRHTPLIERITNWNWAIVDIGCVGLYLQGWKLLDTAKWAARVGQYQGLQWVKNQHLDQWVIGLVCTGFAWKLLEAVRKLADEAMTKEERTIARWNVITSSAELVLWGSVFLNLIQKTQISNTYIYSFGIFAKSLGLLSIAARPKHEFFQNPVASAAA
jgi:hypothetical protein